MAKTVSTRMDEERRLGAKLLVEFHKGLGKVGQHGI